MKFRYLRPISDPRYNLSILRFILLYHWKSVIDAERIAILLTPVIIQMKEKCVQNAISLFIGLLTTIMMRLPKFNSMNLLRGRVLDWLRLPRTDLKGNEENSAAFHRVRINSGYAAYLILPLIWIVSPDYL
jgi:hypothetical protein